MLVSPPHLSPNPRDPNPFQSSGCFTSSSSYLLWTPAAHTSVLLKMKPLILLPGDIQIPKSWHMQLLMILARPSHSIFGSGVEIVCQRESFAKPDPNMSNIMSASVLQRKCSCRILLTFESQDGKMSRAALSWDQKIQSKKIRCTGKSGIEQLEVLWHLTGPKLLYGFQLWVSALSCLLSLEPKAELFQCPIQQCAPQACVPRELSVWLMHWNGSARGLAKDGTWGWDGMG